MVASALCDNNIHTEKSPICTYFDALEESMVDVDSVGSVLILPAYSRDQSGWVSWGWKIRKRWLKGWLIIRQHLIQEYFLAPYIDASLAQNFPSLASLPLKHHLKGYSFALMGLKRKEEKLKKNLP